MTKTAGMWAPWRAATMAVDWPLAGAGGRLGYGGCRNHASYLVDAGPPGSRWREGNRHDADALNPPGQYGDKRASRPVRLAATSSGRMPGKIN